ncbi:Uncharacterised protein [Mycobacteroides abscessus subsp. abscessus]|nr:Uncharacterised protein [Mycobacteroides abscessus subsp. abscessus]
MEAAATGVSSKSRKFFDSAPRLDSMMGRITENGSRGA